MVIVKGTSIFNFADTNGDGSISIFEILLIPGSILFYATIIAFAKFIAERIRRECAKIKRKRNHRRLSN